MKLEIQDGGLTNPMTTQGDIIIGGAAGSPTRLAGAVGVLQGAAGSGPAYTQAPTLTTPVISTQIDLTGGQIKFPATAVPSADPNTLDDYEEGTWTPTIVGLSTAGAGTYSTQTGTYTKIGRKVTCLAYIDISAHTGTGAIGLGGLPFTSAASGLSAISMGYTDRLTYAGAERTIGGYLNASSTQATLIQSGSAISAATVSMDTDFGIIYAVTYFT